MAAKRCLNKPEDPANMTCDDILQIGPFIAYLSKDFLRQVPKEAYCDMRCTRMIRESDKVQSVHVSTVVAWWI